MREEESATAHSLDASIERTPVTAAAAIAADWGPGYQLWQTILALLAQRGPDGTTSLVRLASHLLILFVAVAIIGVSRIQLPDWEIAQSTTETVGAEAAAQPGAPRRTISVVGALVRAAAPITQIQERPRADPTTYHVQPGDTLYAIAEKFGISAETLMWANNMEQNPDLLRLDQELVILPVSGVLHTVAAGDTVDSLAQKYKADPNLIVGLEANHLDPKNPTLTPGAKVIVPGGSKPLVQRAIVTYSTKGTASVNAAAKGRFVWPASGRVTQGFASLHHAVDIGARYGSSVKASDAGVVVAAGWSNVGYGNYVVIDHRNGYQTLYAHLSKIYVKYGQGVDQGQQIGLVGSTGNSTGPHLHFEIHQSGAQRNPFNYLP